MQRSDSEQSFHQSFDGDQDNNKSPIRNKQVSSLAKAKKHEEQDALSESRSQQSVAAYEPPANQYYRSECQVKLDTFLQRYNEDAGATTNYRSDEVGQLSESDEEIRTDQTTILEGVAGLAANAPKDATGCNKIQTMREYIDLNKKGLVRNPRNTFFELSRQYYSSKYNENLQRTITVKPYLITEDHDNFVKDLSMEIIQTNQGCMPIIKTFEYNAYNKNKFVKALKFYNYRTDCSLKKQIIVDEGVMHENFRCYDTSLLHFGNSIIFYKREENWHKLQQYDVTTSRLEEIPGYQIAEPIGEEVRYHLMFSVEFGRQRTSTEIAEQKLMDINDFLEDKIVLCQSYQINEKLECKTLPLSLRKMSQMADDQFGKRAIEQFVDIKKRGQKKSMPLEAIQFVLHTLIEDPQNLTKKKMLFIALDPFNAHHFTIDASGNTFSEYTTYVGNNETQMQLIEHLRNDDYDENMTQKEKDQISNWRNSKIDMESILELSKPNSGGYSRSNYEFPEFDPNYSQEYNVQLMNLGKWKFAKPPPDERVMKNVDPIKQQELDRLKQLELENYQKTKNLDVNVFNPFLKHQNPQFLIQKEKVKMAGKIIDQYYYITNDNEYMLIYPNYEYDEDKQEVLFQIAKKYQYNQNADDEYHYIDDYDQRRKDYRRAIYKKISHVCNEDYRSKNHMKRSEHLRNILEYERPLNINDKILLSTDQERSNIYIYQSNVVTGNNKIQIYNYENNIAWAGEAKTLAQQIQEIFDEQTAAFTPYTDKIMEPHRSYYVNGKHRHVVSNAWAIKTIMIDQRDQDHHFTHNITNNDKDQFMIVEKQTAPGEYINIRIKTQDTKQDIQFLMYNKNRNYYTFFFALRSEKTQIFFAVNKKVDEVEEMGDNNHLPLILKNTDLTVIQENDFKTKGDENLKAYTTQMTLRELISKQKEYTAANIHLTFEKCYDNNSNLDFIPIIYQDKRSQTSHHLIIFDAEKMKVVRHSIILSSLEMRKVLHTNEHGFATYTITRTSDVHDQAIGFMTNKIGIANPSTQKAKYHISSMYRLKETNIALNRRHTMLLASGARGSVSRKKAQSSTMNEDASFNPAQTTTVLDEYLVTFSNCEKNKIQLIGRKQLLLSQVARAGRSSSFKELFMIPYFDKFGKIKGSRLVLYTQNPEDASGKPILEQICIKDQELNNIYHQSSGLIQFGHQKFLINKDSHEEYILIVSCQFKQKVYLKANFENSEAYYVLSKVQRKLMSMQLAKFEYFVLNDDFDELMREEFYQGQEVLEGKTINDLCLNFPKEVQHGIMKDPSNVGNIRGSLAEELCEQNNDLLENLLELNLCEENLLIQVDFNFVSSLRIAMELNSNQSVKILLEQIFRLNNHKYQELLMIDLTKFLQLPNIKRIYDFLERDYEEMIEIERRLRQSQANGDKEFEAEFLNFEDFMNHPELPPYSDELIKYHVKERFHDFHDKKMEVIGEILQREGKYEKSEYLGENRATNIEVEHSSIDFSTVIVGDKVRSVLEHNYNLVNFNDQTLAKLVYIEDDAQLDFYGLEVTRKIIDFQFVRIKAFLEKMFFFYIFGFFTPFMVEMTVGSIFIKNIAYLMCFFTQIFFIFFEIVQVKEQKLDYFKDVFNWVDFSQFSFFAVLYVIKIGSQFQSQTTTVMALQMVIILQAFWKCLYYVRIYPNYLTLVTIAVNIVNDVLAFIAMISVALFGFMKISQILEMGVNDPNGEYSQYSSPVVKLMIQQYKAANGQKSPPMLSPSMFDEVKDSVLGDAIMMGMATACWIVQNSFFAFFGVIFMAQVFQAYEKVFPQLESLSYKAKARFNQENYQILNIFVKQRNFKVLAFQIAKSIRGQFDMSYEGVIKTTQKHQVNAWRKAAEIRRGERENAQKCVKETLQAQADQKVCIREQTRIKEQLMSLANSISDNRSCCCEINQNNMRNH